jgi:hypothetical protein
MKTEGVEAGFQANLHKNACSEAYIAHATGLPPEQQSSIVGRSGRPFFADDRSTGTINRLFDQNGASLVTSSNI